MKKKRLENYGIASHIVLGSTCTNTMLCAVKINFMTEFEIKAKELVNEIYQPLGYLKCMVSNDEMWSWAKDRVREQIKIIKAQIPMYTGNLNPKWKYWDDVEKAVDVIP